MYIIVEVFRTNVGTEKQAECILKYLEDVFPHCKINFDLEDRDNILRMEAGESGIETNPVIRLITNYGYDIEVLPDSPVTKSVLTK